MTELSKRLNEIAASAGYGPGRRAELYRLLTTRHRLPIRSQQTLLNWFSGERRPELSHLRVLLDALAVHGPEREKIVRLALPDGLLTPNREPDAAA